MTYQELLAAAVQVKEKYAQLNVKDGTDAWNGDKFMAGFVGDVGDLSKIIMAKGGYRRMDDVDAKLGHELADCLWSVLVLADHYGIDLEQEFVKTMGDLQRSIDAQLVA